VTDRPAAPPQAPHRLGRRARLAVAGSFAGLMTAVLALSWLLTAAPGGPEPPRPPAVRARPSVPDPRPAFYRSLADDFAAAARGERG
jgi:hypothetical protein